MKHPVEQVGWIVIGLLLGGLIAYSVDALAETDPIVTDSTTRSTVTTNGSMTTTVKSPPPSAIAPQFSAGNGSDLCTVGASGAVQTQILGISLGSTFTEENCIRLKNAKTLYDMGMKVAAVSVMCQDKKVFDAMMMAGTPCPYDGLIGNEAKAAWKTHTVAQPPEDSKEEPNAEEKRNRALGIIGTIVGAFLVF
jgi:hypothetical protein